MKTLIMVPLPRAPNLSVVTGDWLKKDPFQHPPISREVEFEFAFAVPAEEEDATWQRLVRFRGQHECDTVPVPPLDKLYPEVALDWRRSRFGELALYRNMLLEEARRRTPDRAIFLDSDVVPPRGFIDRFRADGKDVCGGVVRTFNNNWDEITGYGTFREPFFSGLDWGKEKAREGNLPKVDFVSTACLSLGWRVLADERAKFEPIWVEYMGEKVLLGEDQSFCRLLDLLGYQPHVDLTMRCAHFRKTPTGDRWLQA